MVTDQQVAALALEEAKKEMAIFAYKPSPTQQRFHDSDTLNRLVTAGGRGGKTTSCLIEVAWLLLGLHPTKPWHGPITVVCLCLSRQQASMTVQKKLFISSEIPGPCRDKPMIPESEIAEYGSVKHGFRFYYDATLKNGSKIHFAWADDESTWKRIQGMQADVVYIDENAGSERLIIELRKRLMDAQSDPLRPLSGRLIWGATGTIVNPTFEKFRDMCLAQFPDHEAFVIAPGETGAISKKAIERLSATLTKEQREIHIDGTATSADLVRIFGKQWNDSRHVLSTDYIPEDTDNLVVGYDPGVDHPTGIMICAIRRDNPHRLIMVKYFEHARQTVDYDVECLRSWFLGRRMRAFVYDYKAKESQKHTKSLILTIMDKFKLAGIAPIDNQYLAADKRHWQGIQTMRDYLDPDHYDKNVAARFVVNPSFDSGGTLVRQQLLAYRGKESTKFTGPGGVIKKEDEACLVGETRILMADGSLRRIDSVSSGEYVETVSGPGMVEVSAMTAPLAQTYEVFTSAGSMLCGTAGHPVFTLEDGWLPIDSLRYGHTVVECIPKPSTARSITESTSRSRAPDTTATEPDTSCIGVSGSSITGRLNRGSTSITLTKAGQTTTSPIYKSSLPKTMQLSTSVLSQKQLGWRLRNGTGAMLGVSGTQETLGDQSPSEATTLHARPAANSVTSLGASPAQSSAETTVNQSSGADLASMILTDPAPSALAHSESTATPIKSFVLSRVVGKRASGRAKVYNLCIEGAHHYFANGILTHNCDTFRYLARQYFQWSARYTCGPQTMKADSPLILRPERLDVQEPPQDDSPFARQCRMSRRRTPEIRAKELGRWGMSPINGRRFI